MAYLDLPADDRLETRLPRRLKQDAEAIARAKGQTLSQWVLAAMAEKASAEYGITLDWSLTPGETETVLRALGTQPVDSEATRRVHARATDVFGEELP